MKATTLVILAAGMGSRFGGVKQIEPVTPGGEIILDFSIYDAVSAGFEKLVFVVRREILDDFKRLFERKLEGRVDVSYVCQNDFTSAGARKKPFGTGHAVWSARDSVHDNFCVINADDFYGRRSFESIGLWDVPRDSTEFAMIGFKLKNTLSEFGTVSRGQCELDHGDFLTAIIERTGIMSENGKISADDCAKEVPRLDFDTLVSMNFWGFTPVIFDFLESDFGVFLDRKGQNEEDEFFINDVVNRAVAAKQASVRVIRSDESWMGITYREDTSGVGKKIAGLRKKGIYPANIW